MKYEDILDLISKSIDKEIFDYIEFPGEYNVLGKENNELVKKKVDV